jgi:hypothetical protein
VLTATMPMEWPVPPVPLYLHPRRRCCLRCRR